MCKGPVVEERLVFKGLRDGLGDWSLEGEEWRCKVGLEGRAAARAPGPCR